MVGTSPDSVGRRLRATGAEVDSQGMMTSSRRPVGVLIACVVTTAAFVGVCSPASADSSNQNISLTTTSFPSMRQGETAWVSTFWNGANHDAHNFRLTATSTGASISYPANTATYSSLYGSSDLLSRSTDYAALKITVNNSATGTVTINLHVTYDLDENNGAHRDPEEKTQDLHVSLPVTVYNGAAITAVTSSLGPVQHGTSSWVQFSVRAEKPGITGFTAQASAPSGITVTYPNSSTSSSPNQGSTLGVLVTDYFAFNISVGNISAGSYNVTITMSYGPGQQQTTVVPLVVT